MVFIASQNCPEEGHGVKIIVAVSPVSKVVCACVRVCRLQLEPYTS